MDEFWTAAEQAFRRRAAGFFRDVPDPIPTGSSWPIGEIWQGLTGLAPEDDGPRSISAAGLNGRVFLFDEAARRDPALGRALLAWLDRAAPLDPVGKAACELGRSAGEAAHVFAAGTAVAKDRGFFSSILMDFRSVQERLAGLVAGAELARLGACRLCRLLERGDTITAGREAPGLETRAALLAADVRTVAESLLGPAWTEARLAGGETLSQERKSE